MEGLFFWSLKVSALLTLIFGAYYFLFRNNTAFHLRRSFILFILLVCSIAPFLTFEVQQSEPFLLQNIVVGKAQSMNPITFSAPSIQKTSITPPAELPASYTFIDYAVLFYGLIALAFFSIFFIQLLKIFYWKISGKKDDSAHACVIRHQHIQAPFSFGNHIFVPLDFNPSEDLWEIIYTHEKAHLWQRHSLDLVFARLLQCLLWYNPMIYLMQREMKFVHEALADREVLKNVSLHEYAQALLQVGLNQSRFELGHSFAFISSLSKRLKLMRTKKTKFRTTLLSALTVCFFTLCVIGWSALRGQDTGQKEFWKERIQSSLISVSTSSKLSTDHKRIIELFQKENPDQEINFRYLSWPIFASYFESFEPGVEPLYIGALTPEHKSELKELYHNDSSGLSVLTSYKALIENIDFGDLSYSDFLPKIDENIDEKLNYIMVYKASPSRLNHLNDNIYDITEVDKAPEVIGGLESLAKTIALDIKIPKDIDKTKLPESIDFEFVVEGGRTISHLNLRTELKGPYSQNKPYYLFFGQVHNALREKVQSMYLWKRGIKNGKEVLVRMKIAIPTKYMF